MELVMSKASGKILAEEKCVIAAASGGPDSMAMLSVLDKNHIRPVVCHVNYHHRPTADRDEQIVRKWCQEHHLLFLKKDAPQLEGGNFQALARDFRYAFFEEEAARYHARIILLAHQQDDALETWLIQKSRHSYGTIRGLEEISTRKDFFLVRPFLQYSKKEMEDWCKENHVPYGIDESNLEDEYLRNQIRHAIIEPADAFQRKALLQEMKKEQQDWNALQNKIRIFLADPQAEKLADADDGLFFLDGWLYAKLSHHFSNRYLTEIRDQIVRKKRAKLTLKKKDENRAVTLILEEEADTGRLVLEEQAGSWYREIQSFDQLEKMVDEKTVFGFGKEKYYFAHQGKKIESFFVEQKDFPLNMGSSRQGEWIELRYGKKKISRILIDQKVPAARRNGRPVLRNRDQKVIFLPQTGCDVEHYRKNSPFYMVKLDD